MPPDAITPTNPSENLESEKTAAIVALLEAGDLDGALKLSEVNFQQFESDLDVLLRVAKKQDVADYEIIKDLHESKTALLDIKAMLQEAYEPEYEYE